MDTAIERWHHLVKTRNPAGLDDLLAENAVFLSPIVHSPQRGKVLTRAYLHAAFGVFLTTAFATSASSPARTMRCWSSRPRSTASSSTAWT